MPCGDQIPHLNSLQKKFGPRGLTVVGVTDGDLKGTLPWIAKFKPAFAWGRDPEHVLVKAYNHFVYPAALLIDASGIVVWSGHPGDVTEAMIEARLAGSQAKGLWEWPAEAGAVRKGVLAGEWSAARAAAASLAPSPEAPLAWVRTAVERFVAAEMAGLRAALAAGDFASVMDRGTALRTALGEAGEASEAGRIADGLLDRPGAFGVMAAQRQVAGIAAQVYATQAQVDQALAELREIAGDHPDTIAAQESARAQGFLRRLRNALPGN